jgi:hypothetical protein
LFMDEEAYFEYVESLNWIGTGNHKFPVF